MSCESTQRRLSDHLEGELRGPARLRVARHLDRCPECGALFRSLARTVHGLRALGPRPSTSSSLAAIIGRIADEPSRGAERIDREERGLRWALAVCLQPASLRRTVRIALVVGVVLTAVNQWDVLAGGRFTWLTAAKIAANFLVPFVVSNLGLVSGARNRAGRAS